MFSRIATVALALVLGWAWLSPLGAVEKKEKKDPTKVQRALKADSLKTKPPALSTGRKPATPKFDSFIDKNKNGIDDRKEQLVPKAPPALKDTASDSTRS